MRALHCMENGNKWKWVEKFVNKSGIFIKGNIIYLSFSMSSSEHENHKNTKKNATTLPRL